MSVTDHLDILIVEDNPGDKKLVDKRLERTDTGLLADSYDLYHEETLEAGLDCLRSCPIDVMLLDLGLPGSTGLETLSKAKSQAGEVPIIVLTGNNDTEMAIAAINEGAQDFLTKDELSGHELVRAIRYSVERARKEQELRAERDFLDTIIESLPYPFYVIDVEDYTIEHANSQALVGKGDTCHAVTHDREEPCHEGKNPIQCPIPDVRETGETVIVEHEHYDEDGEKRTYRVYGTPIEQDGEITKMAESNIDITDRVQYADQLEKQRDNLELLNQVVRHDIRNDLQLIEAYAEMLEGSVDGEDTEYLQTIKESARNAVDLTSTARDLADVMLQEGQDRDTVALGRTLESQVETIRSAHPESVINVDGTIPDVDVYGNDMLDAVFRNLLKNAIQHNDKDVPEVTVSATMADDAVKVSIADNGPGVPEQQREDIFGKGEKGLDSDGTGVGLYLVYTLVEGYGGEVWVEDNEPTGATFIVLLPTVE